MNDLTIQEIMGKLEDLQATPADERSDDIVQEIGFLLDILQSSVQDDSEASSDNSDTYDGKKNSQVPDEEPFQEVISTTISPVNATLAKIITGTTPLDGTEETYNAQNNITQSEFKPHIHLIATQSTTIKETFTFQEINSGSTITLNNPTPFTDEEVGSSVAIYGNYAVLAVQGYFDGSPDAGSAYVYDVTTGDYLYTLENPSPNPTSNYDASVSISGDHVIIGASYNDVGADHSGAAYIYDVTTNDHLLTINNPTPGRLDLFGVSVSISGNSAIIGAAADDSAATDAGAAYIYDITTGTLLHNLTNPTASSTDQFGYAVSIAGNYAAVSAYKEDTGGTDTGSVHLYNVTTGAYLYTITSPTPNAYDRFGSGLSISDSYIVVGSPYDDSISTNNGAVFVYDIDDGSLLYTLNNPTPDSFGSPFVSVSYGRSVAISGNYAIIGAPTDDTAGLNTGSVYIYDLKNGDLLYTLNNSELSVFGSSISASEDYILIGSPSYDGDATNSGIAHAYIGDFNEDGQAEGTSQDDIIYGLDGDDVLAGLLGDDTLYGGDGADTFSFRDQGANDIDRIEDFTVGDNDKLDISDLLTGFDGEIEDYVRIIDDTINAGNSYLMINNDGDADATLDFVAVAYIVNGAGLDVSTLYDNGQIIAI